jgi:hypothetical protein
MLNWLKRRVSSAPEAVAASPARPGRAMSGTYLLLYKYLEQRYAQTVVLSFSEIEDLLGFALPDSARRQREWWANTDPTSEPLGYCDSWILASRTATPNLLAGNVVFERIS